jgi:Fe-S oxidoreductase
VAEVILWADTFNNYFRPETSRAALEVLRAAGARVTVLRRHLCCGRPLYDFGMLDRAKDYLYAVMEALRGPIEAGTPMVVLEPSCASVFRDELRGLFPRDALAERLRGQVFVLSEFLERHAPGFRPPRLERPVLLHGHCHQKALMRWSDEESILRKMGAAVECPDAGCCGMAGPFGFDQEKYEVSQAVGERVLLPALRRAGPETLIVSDGFSCREQILHATERRAIHLAEAIHLAMRAAGGASGDGSA